MGTGGTRRELADTAMRQESVPALRGARQAPRSTQSETGSLRSQPTRPKAGSDALDGHASFGPDGDAAFIQALRRRDGNSEAALEHLYQRHSPAVFGSLIERLGDTPRAEAILVETFWHLWQQPHAAPLNGSKLAPWLLLQAQLQTVQTPPATTLPAPNITEPVRLEDVLITAQLARRPARPPNLQAENDAFFTITRALATGAKQDDVLQMLVSAAAELCNAGTAGLSLLEAPAAGGEVVFRWTHLAGHLASAVGGTTPRSFSPCGVTLDRAAPQLFSYPARYFSYFDSVPVPLVEGLVIPFSNTGATGPTGTIWIVSHDEGRRFDWEDARIMTSLASFTAIALQIASA